MINNILAEAIVRAHPHINGSHLDSNNISWQLVHDEWIGKRSVWTKDNRACWLEQTTADNVKSWWCGKEADYTEVFKKVA